MNHLIKTIQFYQTIDDEKLFIFLNFDLQSVEIFQYEENFSLLPYANHQNESANEILIDDFTHNGWKQILFLKDNFNINSFFLTDFSQIHIFQQDFENSFHVSKKKKRKFFNEFFCFQQDEKLFSTGTNDENDLQTNLGVAREILRKKLIVKRKKTKLFEMFSKF